MDETINSTSNALIKFVRSLQQKKGRRESGLFLVEGIHHIGDVFEAGWKVEALLYSSDLLTSDFGLKMVQTADRTSMRVANCSRDVFKTLTGKENPQGLLAAVHERTWSLEQIAQKSFHLGVGVVGAQDPGNIGTILRTMDAAGAELLFKIDDPDAGLSSVDLFHPSTVRASMGALFWIPVVEPTFLEFTDWVRRQDAFLVGSSAHASVDYRQMTIPEKPAMLLLGSEQKGLNATQMEECDLAVSLPMRGRSSSLNLAVAAGILLYEIANRMKEFLPTVNEN